MSDEHNAVAVSRRIEVYGRVQGVSFRAGAHTEAQRLGLHGWVRNRHDGSVEMVVSGDATAVDRFTEWARVGPPAAGVERVEVSVAGDPGARPFWVRPTE